MDFPFRSILGILLYVLPTRPDVASAVTMVARYQEKPDDTHVVALKRILRYLKGAPSYLDYTPSPGATPTLDAFADATWADDPTNRSSTTGFVIRFAGIPISWASRKQKATAKFSTEAEYVALSDAVSELVWLRQLASDLGAPQSKPSLVFEDNQGAIGLADQQRSLGRAKHIDVRHHYLRNYIANGSIALTYIQTSEQLADVFTKPLASPAFNKHRRTLRVVVLDTCQDRSAAQV